MGKCFENKFNNPEVNGIFHKTDGEYHPLSASHGKFVSMIGNNIDLTLSTSINNTVNTVNHQEKILDHIFKNNNKCTLHKLISSDCHQLSASNGKLVPMVDSNIDLASSTYVNNPIIPSDRPLDCILKNKKYQIIIGFDKDIDGAIWPEWMKDPAIHALGIDKINTDISGIVSEIVDKELNDNIMPIINVVDEKVVNLSTNYNIFINNPATISALGVVRSSDKINQISVIQDGPDAGVMEVNDIALSKISQDNDLIISSISIGENPDQLPYESF